MAFKKSVGTEVTAASPEELFVRLQRTGRNSDGLWSQQTDLLRAYMTSAVDKSDVALELPTGTGKTLTGLLIADWRRRRTPGARAIFACPTKQLVGQVIDAAKREGIPVVNLSGTWKEWPAPDKLAYETGKAMAVVPYSSVFNVSPKLAEADVIVFDDAHAGEQYVSKAYRVAISRHTHPEIHSAALEALKDGIELDRYNQLIQQEPSPGVRDYIDAHVLAFRDDWTGPLSQALNLFAHQEKCDLEAVGQKFAFQAISSRLAACVAYVSWSSIEVRPLTPPTFENKLFMKAKQRVYLSATLGAGGELERAFGRPFITRIPLPTTAPVPKSGRRFFVFPTYVDGVDPAELTRQLIGKAERAVVITPTTPELEKANVLVPESWVIMGKEHVEQSFEPFTKATNTAVLLANRYDGIDLPGASCRIVALFGHPTMTNLQERFYSSRANASAAIAERVRTRVVQGTGRCTRGPRDWALVIIADPHMATYLARSEVRATLDADLQAEIEFGLDQSAAGVEDVLENVDHFLAQDDAWTQADEEIQRIRNTTAKVTPANAEQLAAAAKHEVLALQKSWTGDWLGAATTMNEAASTLISAYEARGYRAVLLFQAAVLMEKARRHIGDDVLADRADAIAENAVSVAGLGAWMNATLPFPGRKPQPVSAALDDATKRLSNEIDKAQSFEKTQQRIAEMRYTLKKFEAKSYEQALGDLGTMLGADAGKPAGDARADSAWCWGDQLWITIEAKNEQEPTGSIGAEDIRQSNNHLKYLSNDRTASIPAGSISVIASPSEVFDRDALVIPEPHLYKVSLKQISALGAEVERLWTELHTLRQITDPGERHTAIVTILRKRQLTPEHILDLFSTKPVKRPA